MGIALDTFDRIVAERDALRKEVGTTKAMTAALFCVLAYDQLLRQYSGPLSTLCAGDHEKIDAAYDAMIKSVTDALSGRGQ